MSQPARARARRQGEGGGRGERERGRREVGSEGGREGGGGGGGERNLSEAFWLALGSHRSELLQA
eukprot:574692-Rhodomonas_salina.1